jgi:uncharacterized membrane protein
MHARATFGVLALTGWALLWELWLAPLRPGGSWLALKAVPLALTLPGLVRGKLSSLQWLALLLPFYFAEAVVRLWSEHGRNAWCAGVALALSLYGFLAAMLYFRERRRQQRATA